MPDFMTSPFVLAAQATERLEAGMMTAVRKHLESGSYDCRTWPEDLRRWLFWELASRLAYDYQPADAISEWVTHGKTPLGPAGDL